MITTFSISHSLPLSMFFHLNLIGFSRSLSIGSALIKLLTQHENEIEEGKSSITFAYGKWCELRMTCNSTESNEAEKKGKWEIYKLTFVSFALSKYSLHAATYFIHNSQHCTK